MANKQLYNMTLPVGERSTFYRYVEEMPEQDTYVKRFKTPVDSRCVKRFGVEGDRGICTSCFSEWDYGDENFCKKCVDAEEQRGTGEVIYIRDDEFLRLCQPIREQV